MYIYLINEKCECGKELNNINVLHMCDDCFVKHIETLDKEFEVLETLNKCKETCSRNKEIYCKKCIEATL